MEGSQRPWHSLGVDETVSFLSTSLAEGLTPGEASRRLGVYGPNSVEVTRKYSGLKLFLGQFENSLVIVLLFAVGVSAILGELLDSFVILAIVVFAAVTGFWQQYRAERVFSALRERLSPTCLVTRGGAEALVAAADIVPGDIVNVDTGTRVPADLRLVQEAYLKVDESVLTGESVPSAKETGPVPADALVPERSCMVFAGTAVASGRGRGVAVATGRQTEFGKIVEETSKIREEKTPLELQVDSLAKRFGVISLGVILVVGGVEVLRSVALGGVNISELTTVLLFAIALGVAAVPEALPAVMTATMAMGSRALSRNNALVRRLSAIETLGSTEVVCFDKTGTLTSGEMTVREVYSGGATFQLTGVGYLQMGSLQSDGEDVSPIPQTVAELARASYSCNDASLQDGDDGRSQILGDPTEGALLVLAMKLTVRKEDVSPRVREIPFSSETKMMTTFHSTGDNMVAAFVKGAPESVLPRCTTSLMVDGAAKLDPAGRESIKRAGEFMTGKGLRVLALAKKESMPVSSSEQDDTPVGLTFLGLVGMEDPLREEAVEAVRKAKEAGIRPVMITGDHGTTALMVATRAGIYTAGDEMISGNELQGLDETAARERVERTSVYARISPLDKLRIVKAWKSKGKVVAMTGDGVNDAPALKQADIGVAMGKSGTDVAKEAADIVLADDDFASMVRAVELGRWIYGNMRKYLVFLLQANLVEIVVLGSMAIALGQVTGVEGASLPLLPVQILYINLATDGLPAIALGFSPIDPDLLKERPRPRHEHFLTRELVYFITVMVAIQSSALILAFDFALPGGIGAAQTRLFVMMVFMELAMAVNCRSLTASLGRVRPHLWLTLSIVWESALIAALLAFPQTRGALHMSVPSLADLAWILGGIVLTVAAAELAKRALLRNGGSRKQEGPAPAMEPSPA